MDELFTPQMTIERYASRQGIKVAEIGVAPTVVISWGRDVIQSVAEAISATPCEHWPYGERQPLFTGQIGPNQVSLVHLPVGAPGTVMFMEELIACGAHTFLGLGWAGSLQRRAPVGTLLIPTACLREEGTSPQYFPDEVVLAPDSGLVGLLETAANSMGVQTLKGPLWTTDAPYRETRTKILAYRAKGVLGVDMETSAMYALGLYRRVRVCNLLVVSDELWDEWRVAFGTNELREATQVAQQVVVRCLGGDEPTP